MVQSALLMPIEEADKKKYKEETEYHLRWVSPLSYYYVNLLQKFSEKRSRNGLILSCDKITRRILELEIVKFMLCLPLDIQEKIKGYWKYKEFPSWYSYVMSTNECPYYDIYHEWSYMASGYNKSGMKGLSLPANPTGEEDKDILYAWDYGMCHGLFGSLPSPQSPLRKHFTKFQNYVFNRAKKWTGYPLFYFIHPAAMEIEGGRSRAPHYLIIFRTHTNQFSQDPIFITQPSIRDHIQARGTEFLHL